MATSQAGGTMTPTECTCSRRIATRTATWRTVQCATPRRTTPHSHSGSKPPLTMWTSIPPHGGLLTGQNSTRALPTLGYRLEQGGEGKRKRDYYGGHGTLAKKLHELFHMNFYSYVSLSVVIFFLLLSPFFIEKKSKVECGGRWNEIRWGEMESEPKKEFMECLLFLIKKKDMESEREERILQWVCRDKGARTPGKDTSLPQAPCAMSVFVFAIFFWRHSCDSMEKEWVTWLLKKVCDRESSGGMCM